MELTNVILPSLIDTPRLYTAIAEWTACLLYVLILPKRVTGVRLIASLAGFFGVQTFFQLIADKFSIIFWVPGMMLAIFIMFLVIYSLCSVSILDACFCCARAFVLAEFVASFVRQLYVWWVNNWGEINETFSFLFMAVLYVILFSVYFSLEVRHIPREERLLVGKREMLGAATIALGAFFISNISFIAPNTPFSSALGSILYVRTLVDFGGLVMLFAQQDKREEFRMRSENEAMNGVLQRQYEQYRLAQDNLEFLKREFHDLKHYMIAIRAEKDPDKREHYLNEMENAILMQEALTNTGNGVLDVVLTTKSAYCTQKKIIFTCMADGKLIDFMDVKDICSIFGNALDNAIECVEQFEDLEKRLITMSIYKQNRLLMMQFENYFEKSLVIENNIPATTKQNKFYHGYGLKSIRLAAQNYGGTMTVHAKDNWFTLQVLIPLKEKEL